MKKSFILILSIWVFNACQTKMEETIEPIPDGQSILNQLAINYMQLPEKEISISADHRVYAQYAMPTKKYGHGILGDAVEAEQLVVVVDSIFYELTLPEEFVFEDLSPRLYDVDGDNELEFICIRTHVSKGAGIAIYKIIDGKLLEFAQVLEIGSSSRWLNLVAINDLDKDGVVELAWIQTPHIGGILKVAKINSGTLKIIDQKSLFSNHAIGQRNLCLSVLTEQNHQKVFYVPNQDRDKIYGFTFKNNALDVYETIDLAVDFSKSLASQYQFINVIESGNNCKLGQ